MEKEISIFKALIYFHLEISTYGGKDKLNRAQEYISNAVASNNPLVYFIPICLRYYYDSVGEQQIFEDLETHKYKNKSGNPTIKSGYEFKKHILLEFEKILNLRSLGVPILIISPIMDHEILRPEKMNSSINKKKFKNYQKSIENFLREYCSDIFVKSSLELFGIPKNHPAFDEILEDINNSYKRRIFGESKFNISDKTFEHTINEDYKRNSQDNERCAYYRNREFARLCVEYGIGEDRVHAKEMTKFSKNNKYSGTFVKLPKGAELDMQIFNTEKDLIVTY